MKRTERRHLKKNDLGALTRQVQGTFEEHKSEATWIVIALVVVGVGAFGYWAWHQRVESRVHALLAEAHARSGQYEQAITAYKELVQRKDGQLPIDGILIQLGRVYRDAGRANDAQQTFNRVIEEFPDSPFNADAKRELDALKKT